MDNPNAIGNHSQTESSGGEWETLKEVPLSSKVDKLNADSISVESVDLSKAMHKKIGKKINEYVKESGSIIQNKDGQVAIVKNWAPPIKDGKFISAEDVKDEIIEKAAIGEPREGEYISYQRIEPPAKFDSSNELAKDVIASAKERSPITIGIQPDDARPGQNVKQTEINGTKDSVLSLGKMELMNGDYIDEKIIVETMKNYLIVTEKYTEVAPVVVPIPVETSPAANIPAENAPAEPTSTETSPAEKTAPTLEVPAPGTIVMPTPEKTATKTVNRMAIEKNDKNNAEYAGNEQNDQNNAERFKETKKKLKRTAAAIAAALILLPPLIIGNESSAANPVTPTPDAPRPMPHTIVETVETDTIEDENDAETDEQKYGVNIGDTYTVQDGLVYHESSNYDYGGANAAGEMGSELQAGDYTIESFSILNPETHEPMEVTWDSGTNINDYLDQVAEQYGISKDDLALRIHLGSEATGAAGWVDQNELEGARSIKNIQENK